MARMSLRADASKYYLGYIWWILEPLLYVLVFYVVFNVLLDSQRADFLVFLMCGKLPFIWFSKTVTQASNSIVGNRGLIGKINISKTLFPMALVQDGLYKQIAVFALLFAVLIFYGYSVSVTWLWLIPVVVVNYLMIVACSLVGAALVCVVRDFSLLISLGMIFLMFTSGIFWDVRTLADPELTSLLLTFNPMVFILDCYRQILMYQVVPDLSHLAVLGMFWLSLVAMIVWIIGRASQYLALKALTA
ncbi:MAG: ABC transporter permease [Halioglobus sp.]